MKILHVFPFFSIKRGGGATWLISEIAKAQSKSKKIKPYIHTGSYQIDSSLIKSVENEGVKVIVSKSYLNKIYIHFMPSLIYSSFKIVKNKVNHIYRFINIKKVKIRFSCDDCI